MVPLAVVALVIFGFAAASPLLVTPSSTIITRASPRTKPRFELADCESDPPEIMELALARQVAPAKMQTFPAPLKLCSRYLWLEASELKMNPILV